MENSNQKYRLVTRSDFDGLACAILLKEIDLVDEIKFVHPKDMQDEIIDITSNDITTNLPYVKGVYLAFDHHLSETIRIGGKVDNHIIDPDAPSAARVVYDYYGGKDKFPNVKDDIMDAVDKADAGQFSVEEVLFPEKWILLNYIMDARTGLGRFKKFRISNYQLMMELIDFCRNHTIEAIMELPDVKERTELYIDHRVKFEDQIKMNSKVYNNLVVIDLTNESILYTGNRFHKYALYPKCNISIVKMWGFQKQNIVFAVGGSIINRTSNTNIGELMLKYDGGGHFNAGTCQIDINDADRVLKELVATITANG